MPLGVGRSFIRHGIYSGLVATEDVSSVAQSDATYAIFKRAVGDVRDFDITGFVGRNPTLFTLVTRPAFGAIYRVDREALAKCAGK